MWFVLVDIHVFFFYLFFFGRAMRDMIHRKWSPISFYAPALMNWSLLSVPNCISLSIWKMFLKAVLQKVTRRKVLLVSKVERLTAERLQSAYNENMLLTQCLWHVLFPKGPVFVMFYFTAQLQKKVEHMSCICQTLPSKEVKKRYKNLSNCTQWSWGFDISYDIKMNVACLQYTRFCSHFFSAYAI